MAGFFDPSLLLRTYRDPVAMLGLGIDLMPLVAIFVFGWGINELVIFYWMENLIIGLAIWVRLFTLATMGHKAQAWFMIFFFPVHYGLFCAVHGMFLFDFFSPAFVALPLFLGASLMWEAVLFWRYFIGSGQHKKADPSRIMFSAYGRIVIVHLAIFAAAFSADALGSPIGGAIAILVMDVLWGIALSVWRRMSSDEALAGAAT